MIDRNTQRSRDGIACSAADIAQQLLALPECSLGGSGYAVFQISLPMNVSGAMLVNEQVSVHFRRWPHVSHFQAPRVWLVILWWGALLGDDFTV